MITIRETTLKDLEKLQLLRADTETVWVEPNPENSKAIALYKKLGFPIKDFPAYLLAEISTFRHWNITQEKMVLSILS